MEYNFSEIEKKWQQQWTKNGSYKVSNHADKPKFYVLDMFPYPSGAGLHVGHPPCGPTGENYPLDQCPHPAVSTETNMKNFRQQLDNIGFCFDWDRQVLTSKPSYYKWTQWIFLQLFKSWYDRKQNKAMPIQGLVQLLETEGNKHHPCPSEPNLRFTAAEWKGCDRRGQEEILMNYRLAYCGFGEVNWCEALGTVLANDEVVNGVSERGGYPVVKKKLRQWYLRITDYADRLLEGLEKVDFSDAMKEMQTNWIGKSFGAEVTFDVHTPDNPAPASGTAIHTPGGATTHRLTVYTTRPDTIFGVDFMVVAPEHELIEKIVASEQRQAVEEYIAYVKSRSERERMAEKKITGCFTGAYAINPFNGLQIPIWISEYVLAG